MMRWLFRPWLFVALSAAAVVGAVVITWAWGAFLSRPGSAPPVPRPVAPGEYEIVWLYPATSSSNWERLIAALGRTPDHLQGPLPGMRVEVGPQTFPRQTTDVPEAALALPGGGRLVLRWYKLTSDWKARDWIEALVRRNPPPLAIIGGSSSDAARELALQLAELSSNLPAAQRPVLALTTATADRIATDAPSDLSPEEEESTPGVPLNRIYPDRTFRLCFSNRQMAAAVTHFLWMTDDLRPDSDPVYLVKWEDDSYSRDLIEGFWKGLSAVVAQTAGRQWGWVTGSTALGGAPALGGGPFPWDAAGARASSFRLTDFPTPYIVDSSVGSFDKPNRFESRMASYLLDPEGSRGRRPGQQRPLLVLTGQANPCRRFLRAVERLGPDQARRFVVATGDAIAFNTVYRDRQVAWPIQDLPFPLVFFCHRNPIDREAGFRPAGPGDEGTAATGTEDVLLYEDLLEALALAAAPRPEDAAALARRLHEVRLTSEGRVGGGAGGRPLFTPRGNRRTGTGEHVVCLRPQLSRADDGPGAAVDRVPPEATIEVWSWRAAGDSAGGAWQRVGEPLRVSYEDQPGGGHVGD